MSLEVSSVSAAVSAVSSSSSAKSGGVQWDASIRLSPLHLSALSHFSQQTAPLLLPYPPLSAADAAEAAEAAGRLSLQSPPSSLPSSPPPLPAGFSHALCQQQLLSAWLSSSGSLPSAPSSSLSAFAGLSSSFSQLSALLSLCSSLLHRLSLLHHHQALIHDKTGKVRSECEALLQQQAAIVHKAQRYADNLAFFNAADSIAQQLRQTLTVDSGAAPVAAGAASASSFDPAAIPALLSRVEQCVSFLQQHRSFFSAPLYLSKYDRLRDRLLRLLRSAVQDALDDADTRSRKDREDREREREKGKEKAPEGADRGDRDGGAQAAWLRSFVLHRSLSPSLSPLLRELESMARTEAESGQQQGGGGPYSATLREVQSIYAAARRRQSVQDLTAFVQEQSRSRLLPALCRSAVSALSTLCSLETQLFSQLFTASSPSSSALLHSLLSSLAAVVYTAIRPVVIRQTDMLLLCEVVSILKEEDVPAAEAATGAAAPQPEAAAQEAAAAAPAASTPSASPYSAVLHRLLHDCQERLAYRASVHIRDSIAGYRHTEADADWRLRMQRLEQRRYVAGSSRAARDSEAEAAQQGGNDGSKHEKLDADGDDAAVESHPVLEQTLLCLSSVSRCLEPPAFKLIAQEAVSCCLQQLLACGKSIAVMQPDAAASSSSSSSISSSSSTSSSGSSAFAPSQSPSLHGCLFLISSLLQLRHELSVLSPVSLSSSHRQLDFSHMQSILPSLFSSSHKFSSFAELLTLSAPRVASVTTDCRRSVDKELTAACEKGIATMTQLLIGPLLLFFQSVQSRQTRGQDGDAAAFGQQLLGIVQRLTSADGDGLAARLADVQALLQLYLRSPATERSLFAPVKRGLADVLAQLRFFVNTHFHTAGAAAAGQQQQHERKAEEQAGGGMQAAATVGSSGSQEEEEETTRRLLFSALQQLEQTLAAMPD